MSAKAEKIVAEALALPTPVRAYVAEKLIESLDSTTAEGLSAAWRDEIRKRCDEIDRGTAELKDAEKVFAEAFAGPE